MTFAVSNKKGRPEAKINIEDFEKLAALQCTQTELAAFFEVSVDTIQRRIASDQKYADAWERGRESGKMSLRRMQFESAKNGNVTMQIWLGKQYLGQQDHVASDVNLKGSFSIELLRQIRREADSK